MRQLQSEKQVVRGGGSREKLVKGVMQEKGGKGGAKEVVDVVLWSPFPGSNLLAWGREESRKAIKEKGGMCGTDRGRSGGIE